MDYENLGDLIRQGVRHHLEYRPKEALARLKDGTLFPVMLERAKMLQQELWQAAETEADRAFLYSDLKWGSGLFTEEEPKRSAKAQREARQWLDTLGGETTLLEKALQEANLAYSWSPWNRETWEAETARQPQ